MTRSETAIILKILRLEWPARFDKLSDAEMSDLLTLWTSAFTDDPFERVKAAVEAIIVAGGREFCPNVGIIKQKMCEVSDADRLTATAAWEKVVKALRNSAYNAAEEFAKLPKPVQEAVGSARVLQVWATSIPADELETVVRSNFRRDFAAIQQEHDAQAKLPDGLKPEHLAALPDA